MPNIHAAELEAPQDSTLIYGLKISVAVAFAASLIKYASTEPHNEPVRYDIEEAKQAISDIQNGINIKESISKLKNFIWFFILDGIIGHGMKKKSIRIDPDEPTKILVHPGAKSKGLYSYIHGYHKSIFAMGAFTVAIATFLKKSQNGWKDLQNFVFHPLRFLNGEFTKAERPSADAVYLGEIIKQALASKN